MRNRSVTHVSDVLFYAIAAPTRRALLDLLRDGSQPAGQIARAFTVSRPAISKHLCVLRHANLVRESRRGRHRFYQLNPGPLRTVDRWLEHYRVFWQAKLGDLKTFVESQHVEAPNKAAVTKRS